MMQKQESIFVKAKTCFRDLESRCEWIFANGGPFFHLSTDGNKQEIIFTCEKDFEAAMNILATCLIGINVRVLAFTFMSNHIHWILEGPEEECKVLFDNFKRKLDRYLKKNGRYGVLNDFSCDDLIPITSLEQLRNEIAYVHRNPFVIQEGMLPHCYLWGDGYLYFNPLGELIPSKKFNELSYVEKRELLMGRVTEMPDTYCIYDGFILASSFSNYKYGMSFFRHASHYYSCLNKNQESSALIAKRLGDKIVLNDEELYPVAASLSSKLYNQPKLKELPATSKIELAQKLHYDFNASNKQISRILAVDKVIIDNLFPEKAIRV